MHSIQDDNKPLLDVQHLRVINQEQILVDDLSFQLHAGQTLALVGESGSGKSVSNLAILGLLPQTLKISGQAYLSDQDILQISETEKRKIRGKKIAMIFQEPMTALNPLHRVEKIIGESLRLQGDSQAETRVRVLELLRDVGIQEPEDKLKRYPYELSGGQRQRVMIAMALALDPEILIADEPTTALDVTLQAQILKLLKKLQQQRKMAMILISHDLNLVRHFSDEVIVMKQGHVEERGQVKSLFENPHSSYTQNLLNHDFGQALHYQPQPSLMQLEQLEVKFSIKAGLLNRVQGYITAIEPLDLEIYQGEALGIVGESGSGKSSLALAIARLIKSEGRIVYLGQDIQQLSQKQFRQLRQKLQLVFQDPFSSLNPRMSVAQLIGEGLSLQDLSQSEMQQRVQEALLQVELPVDFQHRYPHELSGGQRQRVALARALVLQPQLIILDEPTSALDRNTQRAIVALLRKLQQQHQLTYLFISHDLHVVKALCQRVLVLHHAKVVELQQTQSLFDQPQNAYTRELIQASQY